MRQDGVVIGIAAAAHERLTGMVPRRLEFQVRTTDEQSVFKTETKNVRYRPRSFSVAAIVSEMNLVSGDVAGNVASTQHTNYGDPSAFRMSEFDARINRSYVLTSEGPANYSKPEKLDGAPPLTRHDTPSAG